MSDGLPDGLTARPATYGDAPAILAIALARDVADIGRPDWSLDDAQTELRAPGLALERDAVIVLDGPGGAVGFAVLNGIDARVAVHPSAEGRGIGRWLERWVTTRASEAGAGELRQEIAAGNAAARTLLESAGYELGQRYWRMWRALDGTEPEPHWPAGLTPRPFASGADDRPAYELVSDAMRDIPGNTERTFEQWRARALTGGLAPEVSIAVDDSQPGLAAVALCQRHEDATGYVDYVAVSRRWRGRGVGRALLAAALERFAAEGMRQAELWVNGRNESATRLYRSAGMDAVDSSERYVKRLRP